LNFQPRHETAEGRFRAPIQPISSIMREPRAAKAGSLFAKPPVNHSITMMSSNRQSAASRIALPVADVGRRAHSRFEFNARSKQF
ncbi:MAG TPA: hypothetical protein VFS91_04290, partial [Nitrobacter sp.]|nr:hypothetical protein [Nitrobacter sp.]